MFLDLFLFWWFGFCCYCFGFILLVLLSEVGGVDLVCASSSINFSSAQAVFSASLPGNTYLRSRTTPWKLLCRDKLGFFIWLNLFTILWQLKMQLARNVFTLLPFPSRIKIRTFKPQSLFFIFAMRCSKPPLIPFTPYLKLHTITISGSGLCNSICGYSNLWVVSR